MDKVAQHAEKAAQVASQHAALHTALATLRDDSSCDCVMPLPGGKLALMPGQDTAVTIIDAARSVLKDTAGELWRGQTGHVKWDSFRKTLKQVGKLTGGTKNSPLELELNNPDWMATVATTYKLRTAEQAVVIPQQSTEAMLQRAQVQIDAAMPNSCFVCMGGAEAGELLSTGCGCRGSSGTAHLTCLVQMAQAIEKCWDECPTCKQPWTGQAALALGREHVELTSSLPEDDYVRLRAAWILGARLRVNGHLDEAMKLGQATVQTLGQAIKNGGEDRLQHLMLDVMGFLGNVYFSLGNMTDALPLQTKRVAASRQMLGDDAEGTVVAIAELGAVQSAMGNLATALSLMEEALERGRRMRGIDNVETLGFMGNLANLHMEMGNHQLAMPLFTDALEANRRLSGRRHPQTLVCAGSLGRLHHISGHFADALSLLQEAVAGLTVVYSKDHPETQHFIAMLDDLQKDMSDPEVVAHVEAYLRHQRLQAQRESGSKTQASGSKARPPESRSTELARIVSPKPELNDRESMVLEYDQNRDLYIIVLRPKGKEGFFKDLCKPSSLRFNVGTHVIAVGLIKSPELNSRPGLVEGFNEKRGRYCVRLEDRAALAMLKPNNCRAAVPGAGALSDVHEQRYRSVSPGANLTLRESYIDEPEPEQAGV